jgi:hypothetical protein
MYYLLVLLYNLGHSAKAHHVREDGALPTNDQQQPLHKLAEESFARSMDSR